MKPAPARPGDGAARAVIDVITEGAPPHGTDERTVVVDSMDAEDRIVRWLNEVLWIAIGEGFLLCDAEITLHDDGLRATVRGRRPDGPRGRSTPRDRAR